MPEETISDHQETTEDSSNEHGEVVVPMSDWARDQISALDARNAELLAEERAALEPSLERIRALIADLKDNPTLEWLGRDSNSVPNTTEVILPPKLRSFISPEQLAANAAKYPEMSYELDPELLTDVKARLLTLPLIHRTDSPVLAAGEVKGRRGFKTPVPHSWIKQAAGRRPLGNTYGFDEQADLDEFVFMTWGGIYGRGNTFLRGSRHAVLIDSALLLDPHTVVTPHDIAEHTSDRIMKRGIATVDRVPARELRDDYFGKMVSGKDWLEIEARRIARRVADGQATLNDLGKLSADDFGEVKYYGEIPRSSVIASLDTHSLREYARYRKFVREAGFKLPKKRFITRKFLR